MEHSPQAGNKPDYPHWGRVYIIVVIYTAALVVGLWLFSRLFEP
jgi:hypothetical protein